MATLTPQSSAPLLADPHGILCFIDQMQRECPDAPRSRIAEALFEAKGIPAVSSTLKSLKAFVRARLGARNYLKPIRPSV